MRGLARGATVERSETGERQMQAPPATAKRWEKTVFHLKNHNQTIFETKSGFFRLYPRPPLRAGRLAARFRVCDEQECIRMWRRPDVRCQTKNVVVKPSSAGEACLGPTDRGKVFRWNRPFLTVWTAPMGRFFCGRNGAERQKTADFFCTMHKKRRDVRFYKQSHRAGQGPRQCAQFCAGR